jgi:hypothetical protein
MTRAASAVSLRSNPPRRPLRFVPPMRPFLSALVILAIAAPGIMLAQRPNLSGTWVAATGQAPANLPAAPGPVMGARFALAVDATHAVITRVIVDVSMTVSLPLDATRTSYLVPGRLCEGERTFHETATWDGDALVVTIVGSAPAGSSATVAANNRRILRLEGPDRLVVEATMVQQGQSRQVGAVYVRSTEALPAPRPAPPVTPLPATISQVAWIGTTWSGTTGAITTEERWTPAASGGMIAVARTLRGESLAGFEFLCIAERGGSLAYIAMPDARMPATYFYLTALTDSSATFENPAHDYPKLIRYTRTADGGLQTTIAAANGERARSVQLKRAASTPTP